MPWRAEVPAGRASGARSLFGTTDRTDSAAALIAALIEGSLGEIVLRAGGRPFFKRLGGKGLRRAGAGSARQYCGQLAGVNQIAAAEILGFRCTQRAVGCLAQQVELARIQLTQIARLLIEDQGAVAHAANLLDEVADLLEHLAQLAVAAFNENHFVPGIVALADLADAGRRGPDLLRAGLAALNGDAGTQQVELAFGGLAGYLDQIGLFNTGCGARESVSQFAVVGHQ
jgi:hypothetical protein